MPAVAILVAVFHRLLLLDAAAEGLGETVRFLDSGLPLDI
jgi:hypothetical protein